MAKGGDVAGQVTFDIGLTGCTGNTDRATKNLTVFVGNQVTSNGNLGNTGDATNVEVQLLDTANKVINLTNGFKGEGDLQLKPGETKPAPPTLRSITPQEQHRLVRSKPLSSTPFPTCKTLRGPVLAVGPF